MKQTIFQLHDIRSGFRKNRSNILVEQLVKLETFIRDAFVYKLRTYAASVSEGFV